MSLQPVTFEVFPAGELIEGRKIPAYTYSGAIVPTMTTTAVFFDRVAIDDPEVADFGGRLRYVGGASSLAKDATNASYKGHVVLDFRPGLIPVAGTPGIGGWVAYVPDDVKINAPCPYGMVSWMNGSVF